MPVRGSGAHDLRMLPAPRVHQGHIKNVKYLSTEVALHLLDV